MIMHHACAARASGEPSQNILFVLECMLSQTLMHASSAIYPGLKAGN